MGTEQPDHIGEAAEKLAEMHREHSARSTSSQRLANRATRVLGRPGTVLSVIAIVAAWVLGNLSAAHFHARALEPAPFPDLALLLAVVAVVVSLLILSTQQHGEELAQRRAELTLQMALLSEQKIAKVIELLEKQRVENPLLTSQPDAEAEQMAKSADTREALARIDAARPDQL